MPKTLYLDPQAEKEANDIGMQFMDSSDVVGDMERAYHVDFSSVNIRTDADAARKTEAAGVDAFASGKDIFFGKDIFDRNDPASRGLLAHELAHTMQQGLGGDAGEGSRAVETSVAPGAEQGGKIMDFFRNLFRKKPVEVSGPMDVRRDDSPEAEAYRLAMRNSMQFNQYNAPQARVGNGGGAEAAANFRDALQSGGFIEQSNNSARTANRSQALVDLGIRTSETAASRAERAMRGNIYEGLSADYTQMFHDLEAQGIDMNEMADQGKSTSGFYDAGGGRMDKLSYATGAGYESLSGKAFDMFSSYLLSDQSLDYVKNFMSGVGSADVFGGEQYGIGGASGFALQTLINTVGANTAAASRDKNLTVGSRRAAVNVGRNIGSLPKMAIIPEDQVPVTLRPLRQRYIQLQAELDRRLQERG